MYLNKLTGDTELMDVDRTGDSETFFKGYFATVMFGSLENKFTS